MGCSRKGRHLSVQKNIGRVIGTQLGQTSRPMLKTKGIFTAFFRGCLCTLCEVEDKLCIPTFKNSVALHTCEFTRKHRPPAANRTR
jgi:hypothetical protein